MDTTLKIIDMLEERVARDKYLNAAELRGILKEEMASLLDVKGKEDAPVFDFSKKPYVIMVVGVNGVGKTTTIGKLAANLKASGKKVMMGAADTFRAAAVDQLVIWSERAGVPIVKQNMGADPASVAFDTVKSAVAQDMDVVLIDTAGRLHNKINLMNELTKIRNVMRKVVPDAPHEVLLVLDGSTAQNAFIQAREFTSNGCDGTCRYEAGRYCQGRCCTRHCRSVQYSGQVYRSRGRYRRLADFRQEGFR